ncbi:MgtC/SapB family protein [Siphonobacter sp. SORGH_AS_1065]|uniref:MgtC/SapB family protein n=1 Tax=Siphonobacter sp. SORGH_AS_1065 TaxID=3041795 RepID=UPI002783DE9E|nr:MgtC/SapB family protein [Siphonobacter sp. SORGH_AS_1065]MDQ1089732.1 putative Mg2+ transporter-C (MgtC) family protein [Siphonobacter sp. SORGH_AS_1065]
MDSFDVEILLRFALAVLWGGIVGAEREYRSKSAGFRTMIMISMGACFFTMISNRLGAPGNPDRLAAGIVTGIGFLGAGVIFRGDSKVIGITTAATIWTVAAVGMGIGAGYYFASAWASIVIFLVLAALPSLENYIDERNQSRTYILTTTYSGHFREEIKDLLKQTGLKGQITREIKEHGHLTVTWIIQGSKEKHDVFIAQLMENKSIQKWAY